MEIDTGMDLSEKLDALDNAIIYEMELLSEARVLYDMNQTQENLTKVNDHTYGLKALKIEYIKMVAEVMHKW